MSGLQCVAYWRHRSGDTWLLLVGCFAMGGIRCTLRAPWLEYVTTWSFPLAGIIRPSAGFRIDMDTTCFDGLYPKSVCSGESPLCKRGIGGECSRLPNCHSNLPLRPVYIWKTYKVSKATSIHRMASAASRKSPDKCGTTPREVPAVRPGVNISIGFVFGRVNEILPTRGPNFASGVEVNVRLDILRAV